MRSLILTVLLIVTGAAGAQYAWQREGELSTDLASYAEFVFTRVIFDSGYQALPGPGNTAWRDWPESDMHFIKGVRRLTSVNIEDGSRAIRLTDEQLFDRPWIYALEVGTWRLSDEEAAGCANTCCAAAFLVVDDFHGSYQWSGFMRSMRKVFPDRSIEDIGRTTRL